MADGIEEVWGKTAQGEGHNSDGKAMGGVGPFVDGLNHTDPL